MRIAFVEPAASLPGSELARIARAQERELARRGHALSCMRARGVADVGDAEIVHVFHGAGQDDDLLVGLARRAALVLFLHDEAEVSREALACADRVVVPSRTHLVRLAEALAFGPTQVRLLEPGLDLELPATRRRPGPWRGEGPLRLLLLGGRRDARGMVALARALAATPAGAVELLAPGPGEPQLDRLLAGLLRERRLVLLPELSSEDLVELAAECHLALFPSSRPESYALEVDVAVALGLPVWASGAEAALERYGAGVLELLPVADADAWGMSLAEWLDQPELSAEAFGALPAQVPTAAAAAETLERWDQELLTETRDRLRCRRSSPRKSA